MTKITPDVIEAHQLTPSEYDKILSLLGREPTMTELGIFSVMWSEHCSYKSTRVHLKKLPTAGRHVLQGPGDDCYRKCPAVSRNHPASGVARHYFGH